MLFDHIMNLILTKFTSFFLNIKSITHLVHVLLLFQILFEYILLLIGVHVLQFLHIFYLLVLSSQSLTYMLILMSSLVLFTIL